MTPMMIETLQFLSDEFNAPTRDRVKIKAWSLLPTMSVVLQVDQPNRENAAYLWVPYPSDGQAVPEIATEYPGEAGRHSGAYSTPGLRRGEPALRLTIRTCQELGDSIAYVRAMHAAAELPKVRTHIEARKTLEPSKPQYVDVSSMPQAEEPKPTRKVIPRLIQREVWQRDSGRCVECATRSHLCFDHIISFSRGGSKSVRNIQILCEACDLSKGNRL